MISIQAYPNRAYCTILINCGDISNDYAFSFCGPQRGRPTRRFAGLMLAIRICLLLTRVLAELEAAKLIEIDDANKTGLHLLSGVL